MVNFFLILASYLIKRATTGSTESGASAIGSSSNSSHTSSSSSESLCTQCSCSGHYYRCKEIVEENNITCFLLAPQTPSNWKLGRQLGQGKFDLFHHQFIIQILLRCIRQSLSLL
jgi:hypothetical protein